MAGFEKPILHGLCTFGVAGRALLHTLCGGEPARFGAMEGRFAKPAYPGDGLATQIWLDGDRAIFETRSARGEPLIERGEFSFAKE
jgi:acyl dehydratase